MTTNEKIKYVKARLAGAICFEHNIIEAEKWRKALFELEAERLEREESIRQRFTMPIQGGGGVLNVIQ